MSLIGSTWVPIFCKRPVINSVQKNKKKKTLLSTLHCRSPTLNRTPSDMHKKQTISRANYLRLVFLSHGWHTKLFDVANFRKNKDQVIFHAERLGQSYLRKPFQISEDNFLSVLAEVDEPKKDTNTTKVIKLLFINRYGSSLHTSVGRQ